MSLEMRYSKRDRKFGGKAALLIAALSSVAALSSCTTAEVMHNGYVVDQESLDLVPVGASREQALLTLGTPSTTATFDNEVFYYISQKRTRAVAFMKPKLVEQNVLAIYFNKDGVVERRANYSLQDGRVFDTISRTTPTGGRDLTFLQQILSGASGAGNANFLARQLLNSN
ncbi:outer membrane protein assembly factor BamE [Rhizobiaceae bacterium BDR2-2]|uniref:Outer membrane protein assembly factor BamE n=1 Tax=Ectorhizobium quercum TaxID=2965071 RepID=A0AAE3N485_9HYPH|nr:outer membrane protein assembly factor BamE [Ectorhizobium quercum]MCX8998970.1 outer membrane protein assembly factor BamE [Ectorhizobium quercum]